MRAIPRGGGCTSDMGYTGMCGLYRWVFASPKYVHMGLVVHNQGHHDKVGEKDHAKTYANVYMVYNINYVNVLCKRV